MLWRRFAAVIVIIAALVLPLVLINSRYQTVKQNYKTLKKQYQAQIETVKSQQQKLDTLHQLDIQHTEELNNAKSDIDRLHDVVHSGTKRLRIKTVCSISQTATAKSRHDEAATPLSEKAREDYFHLRALIVDNEKQTEYLQQYIKTQCQLIFQ